MKGTGSLSKATRWPDELRVGLSLGTFLVYLVLFIPVYRVSWMSRSAVVLSLAPVISFAVAFGLRGGLLAGLLSIPANILLFLWAGEPELAAFMDRNFFFSHLVFVLLGATVGYLRDARIQLKQEKSGRIKAERELKALVEAGRFASTLSSYIAKEAQVQELLRQQKSELEALRQVELEIAAQLDLDPLCST